MFSASSDLSTLSVIPELTSPAPGIALVQSPSEIDLTFNQAFDPTTVGIDVDLQQIASDGSVIQDDGWMLSEPFDLTGAPVTLPVTINGTLGPGEYRIVLTGSFSMLTGLGQNGNPGVPLANSGVDQAISVFTIVNPGQTLASATDLGTVGPVATKTSGSLDLLNDPGDYQLYKVTLGPGHFWRLGSEVTPQGSAGFSPSLALFDSTGNLVSYADSATSAQKASSHLFAGLAPGTYYLGVSNSGNSPFNPGGYDPVTGVPGTGLAAVSGGPFKYQLHVVADTADTPTTVLGMKLNWADPLSTSPTGFSLVFSGPIDISNLQNAAAPGSNPASFPALAVVDQNGRTYSITLVKYVARNSEFDFIFDEPLPAGQYSLVDPAQGGLKDLTGRLPVAAGQPASVLATWTVQPNPVPPIPGNLGVVWSGPTAAPAWQNFALKGESGTIYRFVAPTTAFYNILSQCNGGPIAIELIGPNGLVQKYYGQPGTTYKDIIQLDPGVYYLQFIATSSSSAWGSFSIGSQLFSPDIVLENGIGQGSALNLTLINPVAPSGPDTPPVVSNVFDGPQTITGSGATPGPLPPLGIPAATDVQAPTGSPGLVLTLGNTLVGTPTPGAEHVAAVGPGVQTGYTALAANTPGVLQGIKYGRSPANVSNWDRGESLTDTAVEPAPDDDDNATEAVVAAPVKEAPAPIDGALVEQQAPLTPTHDERVLLTVAGGNWLGRIGTAFRDWFRSSEPTQADEPEVLPHFQPRVEPILIARDDLARPNRDDQPEHADLTTPLGLSVIAVLAIRLQQPVCRWVGRRRSPAATPGSTPAPGRGPHCGR